MIPDKVKKILEKQQYRIIGSHSAVKICHWTKESLTRNRVCFKEKWYPPVESHRCMQMTPSLACNHKCLWCWRVQSGDRPNLSWKEYPFSFPIDEPKDIIEGCIEARKILLSGFGGNPSVDKKKFKEALKPTMMTMSLIGEPTLYPRLSELIEEAKKRDMITFLVTNGTNPEVLEKLDPLPWQLYITLPAPDEETYLKACRPLIKDGWKKINESLELFPSLDCRKVLRLTLAKGLNMKDPEKYAKLIEKAEPNFCEVKAFMHVGEAQKRLPRNAMPLMEEVKSFAEKIADHCSYRIKDEDLDSRVVLLEK